MKQIYKEVSLHHVYASAILILRISVEQVNAEVSQSQKFVKTFGQDSGSLNFEFIYLHAFPKWLY